MQITLVEQNGHLHHEGEMLRSQFAGWSYPVRWRSSDAVDQARNRYQLAQALRDMRGVLALNFTEAQLPDGSRFVVDHELQVGESSLRSDIEASFAEPAMEL